MKTEQLWNKNFVIMITANLCTYLALQMLGTTLPIFITGDLGGNNSHVGVVVGLTTIASLIARPFAGQALMKYKKKIILTTALTTMLVAMAGYFFVSSITFLFVVRVIHGIGFGLASTTIGTIAADIIPPTRRGEGIGYYGLASTIALAIGPVVGLIIAQTLGFPSLYLGCFSLILMAILLVRLVKLPKISMEDTKEEKRSILSTLFEKKALIPSVLLLCLGVTIGCVSSFIALFGLEQGIENVSFFFFVEAIFVTASRPITGKVFDKYGHSYVIIPCGIFMFVATLMISFSHSLTGLLIAGAIYGMGFGAMVPSLQAWTISLVEPHRRGVATSTFYAAMDIGVGVGAAVCGVIANATSYGFTFRVASAFVIVMFFVYFGYLFKGKELNKHKYRLLVKVQSFLN